MSWQADIIDSMADGLNRLPQSKEMFDGMFGMFLTATQNWSDQEFRANTLLEVKDWVSEFHKDNIDKALENYKRTGYLD